METDVHPITLRFQEWPHLEREFATSWHNSWLFFDTSWTVLSFVALVTWFTQAGTDVHNPSQLLLLLLPLVRTCLLAVVRLSGRDYGAARPAFVVAMHLYRTAMYAASLWVKSPPSCQYTYMALKEYFIGQMLSAVATCTLFATQAPMLLVLQLITITVICSSNGLCQGLQQAAAAAAVPTTLQACGGGGSCSSSGGGGGRCRDMQAVMEAATRGLNWLAMRLLPAGGGWPCCHCRLQVAFFGMVLGVVLPCALQYGAELAGRRAFLRARGCSLAWPAPASSDMVHVGVCAYAALAAYWMLLTVLL